MATTQRKMFFTIRSALDGGYVRAGLEERLCLGKGRFAKSNVAKVKKKIRAILESLSLEFSTANNAGEIHGLQGAGQVAF